MDTLLVKLLEKLIGIFPTYADHLLRLITGPKRFIAERVSKNELEVGDALVFLSVSFLLASTLNIPFSKPDQIGTSIVANIVDNITVVIAWGLSTCLAWRCVGGNAELRHMFSITFYYAGIWGYIVNLSALSTLGILNEVSTELYKGFYNSYYGGCGFSFLVKSINSQQAVIANELIERLGLYGALTLPVIIGGLAVIPQGLWIFIGWGAYRKLNVSCRFRSCLAFVLFSLFFAPVWALLALAGLQLTHGFAQEPSC